MRPSRSERGSPFHSYLATLKSTDVTQAMLIGIVLDLIVIPWPHVVANYVAKRGDRWRREA